MYTLAIDRADEQVAHLFNPLHPAILRLIQFTTQAALRARIPVSVCGEMAGDPRYAALLLGLGVRELSMTALNLPQVKQRIRNIDLTSATMRAQIIMEQIRFWAHRHPVGRFQRVGLTEPLFNEARFINT